MGLHNTKARSLARITLQRQQVAAAGKVWMACASCKRSERAPHHHLARRHTLPLTTRHAAHQVAANDHLESTIASVTGS